MQTLNSTDNFNQQTVFVVDDEPDVRAALRLLIKSVGYDVECFSSADEFFGQFEAERKGCLILDVRMPGMSGMDLQEKLSSMETLLPIIMISGHGEIPMAVKAVPLIFYKNHSVISNYWIVFHRLWQLIMNVMIVMISDIMRRKNLLHSHQESVKFSPKLSLESSIKSLLMN